MVIVVALSLWSLRPVPAAWALVLAYAIAWLAINALAAWRPALVRVSLARPQGLALLALLALPSLAILWRHGGALLDEESLTGLSANVRDRLRLEDTPSIAPPVVVTDAPQTFYIDAPGARRVRVRIGPRAAERAAVSLGAGLFRVGYDPRRDGVPRRGEGPTDVTLLVDGQRVHRTLTVVRPLAHPRWLRPSPDRRLAATVSEETDALVVVSAQGLVRRTAVGDEPTDCAFLGADRIAVSHRFDDTLWVVDARTGAVLSKTHLARFAVRLAVSPSGQHLAVAVDGLRRGVFSLALPSMHVEGFVPLPVSPDWIAFGPDDDTLLVSTRRPAELLRLHRGPKGFHADGAPLVLGRPAVTLARVPDGRHLLVATTDYRPTGGQNPGNHFVQDQILTVDTRAFRVVRQWLTARRSARQNDPGNVDWGASPMGIDAAADGSLLIAFAGTDGVWEVVPSEPAPRIHSLDGLPLSAPHGIVRFAGGRFAVTSPSAGTIGVFRHDGSLATLVRLAPDDDVLLRTDQAALARRMGEHDFYEATRSGVSCQSCHLHADSDWGMHDIGEHRLSPTLTVRGVAGTAPYLSDGSYPRVRDLDELSRTLYRGFLRIAPGRALTMENYVEGLPRLPSPLTAQDRDLGRERAGVRAFVEARCPTCHAFPAFTNLGQHPLAEVFPDHLGKRSADAVIRHAVAPVGPLERALPERWSRRDPARRHREGQSHRPSRRHATAERARAGRPHLLPRVPMTRRRDCIHRIAALTVLGLALAALSVVGILVWRRGGSWEPTRMLWLARGTGWSALVALSLALSATPAGRLLARLAPHARLAPWVAAFRRAFGIAAASLALIHATTVLGGTLRGAWGALLSFAYLRAGLVALLILTVMLLTSFPWLVRRLHVRLWKPLHRLGYVAALLVLEHLVLSPFAPRAVIFALFGTLAAFGLLRLLPARPRRRSAAQRRP